MDELDRANDYEMRHRQQSLQATQLRAQQKESPMIRSGKRICLDCQERIDPERMKANPQAVRCTYCQADHERSTRHGL